MIEQDFSIKARLSQKAYCSDIYQPYGCSKPSLITENSANENHFKLAQKVR
jgi:hypothetical protein